MREILFRGRCNEVGKYNGHWIEGHYGEDEGRNEIFFSTKIGIVGYSCEPESIGQYTGLTDKNGKKIFEGDIISCGYLCDFFVEYSEEDAEYWANFGDSIGSLHTYFDPKRATVIGNIYDNPELLEVKE